MASLHIDRLLDAVIKMGGSDLHITVGRPPPIRIGGKLRSLDTKVLEPDDTVSLMKSITPEKNQQELQEVGGTDFGFAFGDAGRFRTAVFRQKGNVTMVLRLIPSALLSFEQIGLPKICAALCRRPRGLFLVTGPTGSGKTTTLASMINYINESMDHHIITIEEPIEYYHMHKKAIICSVKSAWMCRHFPRRCAVLCVKTRMWCWSAKCETWKPLKRLLPPPKPAT